MSWNSASIVNRVHWDSVESDPVDSMQHGETPMSAALDEPFSSFRRGRCYVAEALRLNSPPRFFLDPPSVELLELVHPVLVSGDDSVEKMESAMDSDFGSAHMDFMQVIRIMENPALVDEFVAELRSCPKSQWYFVFKHVRTTQWRSVIILLEKVNLEMCAEACLHEFVPRLLLDHNLHGIENELSEITDCPKLVASVIRSCLKLIRRDRVSSIQWNKEWKLGKLGDEAEREINLLLKSQG